MGAAVWGWRQICVLWSFVIVVAASGLLRVLGGVEALSNGRFQFTQPLYSTTEDFGVAYITVQRSLGADGRAAVYVSTIPGVGNAVAGRDFKPLYNVSLVWQDGEDSEKALYVPVFNDGKPQETSKTFTLRLHDALGAEINPDRNYTQIVLVPPSNCILTVGFCVLVVPGSFSFETAALSVAENNTLVIPVLWEEGTTSNARVQFEIECETACSPGDFELMSPVSKLLAWTRDDFPANATSRMQQIVLKVPDDGLYEPAETFRVRLVAMEPAEDAVIGTGEIGDFGELLVTIAGPNDVRSGTLQFEADCFPGCASNKYWVIAGGTALVLVQRRDGSDEAVSVTVATQDDTALAGLDYEPLEQELSWEEGDTSDRQVLVKSLDRSDPRLPMRRVALVLRDSMGAVLAGAHASTSYVDISTPTTGVYLGDVNFATPEPLEAILRVPDLSFIALASRDTSSRLQLCPRMEVTKPGVLSVALQRNFDAFAVSASVTVQTVAGTALPGVDFEPLVDIAVVWEDGDAEVKHVNVTLLTPPSYDPHPRSFWLQISDVKGANLGDCNMLEVVLVAMAQGPHLASFDLDMDADLLTLELSVPVLASTLDVTKLLLQSEGEQQDGPTFVFNSMQTTTSSDNGAVIVLNIGVQDLNALKRMVGLAKTANLAFLSVESGLFQYVLDDCEGGTCTSGMLVATPQASALAVKEFTADATPPTLLGYSLDLPRRLLKLHFSEPVDFASLNIGALAFAETAAGIDLYQLSAATTRLFAPQPDPLSGAFLRDANRLPADNTFLTLQLGHADVTALKNFGGGQVGVTRASTFLSLESTFVADFAVPGNLVTAVVYPTDLLQASPADCSPCSSGSFLTSSCSDLKDRQCSCTLDEYEVSPCAAGVDRVCRTCNSCSLTAAQQRMCQHSPLWKRLQMRAPYGCPLPSQRFQTREAELQRAQANRCGSGRCACIATGIPGNSNPNGDGFPDDERCTGPAVYNILV
ncbi:hypothetical protein BBJ28_00008020 [Nothophytophthora sp. Chile5]|nr:hypothetical protein BBJ28_00008020 [Nothophytophthora sp. Chile5]